MEIYKIKNGAAKLNPHTIFVWATLLFLLVFVSAPFVPSFNPSIESLSFFILNCIALYLPFLIYRVVRRRNCTTGAKYSTKNRYGRPLTALLNICIIFSSIGYVLRFYDKFSTRGISLAMEMSERLTAINDSSGTTLGTVSAFLYPLSVSALILFQYIKKFGSDSISFAKGTLVQFLFFLPAIEAAMLGKRGALMSLVAIYIFTSIWFSSNQSSFFRRYWKIILLGVISLVAFIVLLNLRLNEVGGNAQLMLMYGRVTDLVQLTPGVQRWMRTGGVLAESSSSIFSLWIYFVHGFYEYLYQYDAFNSSNAQWGSYTFWIVEKFMAAVGIGDFDYSQVEEVVPRMFVYTTLFGPIYIDFVGFSPLFNFAFGALVCLLYGAARKNILFLPLYVQCAVVVAFYPVVNMLTMFQGFYNIISGLIFFATGTILFKLSGRNVGNFRR